MRFILAFLVLAFTSHATFAAERNAGCITGHEVTHERGSPATTEYGKRYFQITQDWPITSRSRLVVYEGMFGPNQSHVLSAYPREQMNETIFVKLTTTQMVQMHVTEDQQFGDDTAFQVYLVISNSGGVQGWEANCIVVPAG